MKAVVGHWSLVVGLRRPHGCEVLPTTKDERPRICVKPPNGDNMKINSKSKSIVALVLVLAIATTGCSSQWIDTALQDLPVLTQMALTLATLVSTLSSGQQASSADVAVIQNISAQASRDLNLLQTLYNEYKANPSTSTLRKIQNAIADLNQNLPASLQAAHISNA